MKSINNFFKFFKSKRGIQLSVNFLVILMISLVVFGMGMAFLYKLVGGAFEKKAELDSRTEQELLRLLVDDGKRVALPLHIANLYGGDDHVFGIGILNIGAESNEFYLDVQLDSAVNEEGGEMRVDTSEWVLYQSIDSIPIKEGEHKIEPIMVSLPGDAPKGKYIFDAKVYEDSAKTIPYGNTQKFIVNVH